MRVKEKELGVDWRTKECCPEEERLELIVK